MAERSTDVEWDYRAHIDPRGKMDDRLFASFQTKFADLYRFPLNQRIVQNAYPIPTLVYLWNASILKVSRKKADHSELLNRIREFRKAAGTGNGTKCRFLVRVDDFPRFDIGTEGYLDFHDVAKEHDVDYLLAITPFLSSEPLVPSKGLPEPLTDGEGDILRGLKRDGVEFGLHGMTHRTLYRRYRSETVGSSDKALSDMVKRSKKAVRDIGIDVDYYVPPFNTIDLRNYNVIKGHFKGITGGPETVPTLGMRLSPSRFAGSLYIPVYEPFYGECRQIASALDRFDLDDSGCAVIPLAVHWRWEVGTGFENFKRLCQLIGDRTMRWEDVPRIGEK